MTNQVKWMHQGMAGAPVLTNNWGSLTALLDACLVNGFNLQTVSAITRTDSTATAILTAGHGFTVDQVVRVAGSDQPDYTGEFTVTAVTSTTVSFTVNGTPVTPATTATSLTMKVAPLGFEIAYTGTNKRAYRSPNPRSNRPFLRVDDSLPTGYTTTWAKFGRVTIAEGMSDIDTWSMIKPDRRPHSTYRALRWSSSSASVNFLLRSARISCAAMKVATGTMPSNAPSLRIHISGGLSTCFFLSLKEWRL